MTFRKLPPLNKGMKTNKKIIGDRIRAICQRTGLTQRGLAKATGTAESVISAYVNGDRYPSIENLTKIAEIGGCTLDWIVLGTENLASVSPEFIQAAADGKTIETVNELEQQLLQSYRHSQKPRQIIEDCYRGFSLLKETIQAIETELEKENLHLDPPNKAKLVTICYEEQLKLGSGYLDNGSIDNMMKLFTMNRTT